MSGAISQLVGKGPTEGPRPVPFAGAFVRAFGRPADAAYRRLVGAWLLVTLAVVPSGMLTRVLEWTGLPVRIAGAEIYLTVYLPLLACVPLVLWLGYWWGAVPAYLSTFLVGVLGGMPLPWIFVFSLANPLGLAALNLGYRAMPVRSDLRSAPAFLFYVLAVFISSIVGSAGSFIWALTNAVGAKQFYPIWQGWWLGGFAQAIFLCAPILMLAGPAVERWKDRLSVDSAGHESWNSRSMLAGATTVTATIVAFVMVVRRFTRAALDETLSSLPASSELRTELVNVFEGVALPQWVLVTLLTVTLFFGFRLGLRWSTRYRELAHELEQANRKLLRTSITDALTGIYNRAHLLDVLPREISACRRHGRPLSCLILDLDHFKSINDRFGHLAGDDVLVRVAELIRNRLRREDIVARFGGEEFVVLLPDTSAEGAFRAAEDMRRKIEAETFEFDSEAVRATTSIGVAELTESVGSGSGRALLASADEALYRAKALGRNRTVLAGAPERHAVSA